MRPQHREVVGDGLRVRGTDADVDDGHAALVIAARQVVGRHLKLMPGGDGEPGRRFRRIAHAPGHRPSWADQAVIGAGGIGQLGQSPGHELVEIALVVGEQNPGLHVPPVRARVMHQTAQRVIHAHRVEQRKGLGLPRIEGP